MRFRCKRSDLAQAVAVVASAVPTRTSVPILQNVKMSSEVTIAYRNFEVDAGSRNAPALNASGFRRTKSSGGFRYITTIASSAQIMLGTPE